MPKTTRHALWGCPKAQEVWECSKLALSLDRRDISFMDILWQLLLCENVSVDCISRLVMIAWKVWHRRNEWRLNGVLCSGKQLVFEAMQHWAEFLAANEGDVRSSLAIQSRYWSPPPPGLYKVNVDALTFKDLGSTGIGVVIHDSLGTVAAALCRKLDAPLGPLKAESKAFEAGIMFALCRGCSTVVLEGDSQVVVNALVGSSPSPSAVDSVIQGILELCRGFTQFQFSHIKRKGNMPAHLVAKNAYSIVNDIVWVEEDFFFAKHALIHDVKFMFS